MKEKVIRYYLRDNHPLMSEWDYDRNDELGISPNCLFNNSNKKANWICSVCGYRWITTIYHRAISKTGCPCCSGQIVAKGINDLESQNPLLASEWMHEKNDILPSEVTSGSGKIVWWKCSICDHEWKSDVKNRTVGNNCPNCQGNNTSFVEQCIYFYLKQVFSDSISRYIEPKLKKEIDVYIQSLKFGIEYDGFRYHQTEEKRDLDDKKTSALKSIGISILRIRETSRQKNCMKLPELMINPYATLYYCPAKRFVSIDKLIYDIFMIISKYSDYTFCLPVINSSNDRFSVLHAMYQGRINNSLSKLNPEIAKNWDYNRNYPLKPNEVTSKSTLSVNWLCPTCGYSYERTIINQTNSKGCPKCSKHITSDEYSFAYLYPKILIEWDYEKNAKIDPYGLMPLSHSLVFWKCCKCNNSWKASVAHRVNGTNCPKCGRVINENSIKKPVAQIDRVTGCVISEFESARDAERKTGISYKHISSCCCGSRNSTGGYYWKFIEQESSV